MHSVSVLALAALAVALPNAQQGCGAGGKGNDLCCKPISNTQLQCVSAGSGNVDSGNPFIINIAPTTNVSPGANAPVGTGDGGVVGGDGVVGGEGSGSGVNVGPGAVGGGILGGGGDKAVGKHRRGLGGLTDIPKKLFDAAGNVIKVDNAPKDILDKVDAGARKAVVQLLPDKVKDALGDAGSIGSRSASGARRALPAGDVPSQLTDENGNAWGVELIDWGFLMQEIQEVRGWVTFIWPMAD